MALPDVEQSLQLRPDDAHFIDTRAHIYEALGRTDEAIADYHKALQFDPTFTGGKEALKRLGVSP